MTTIGFHTGVAGNNKGIDEYIKNNVRPFIKSTDDYGILQYALLLNKDSLCVFRQPVYDVPDYSLSPRDSALKHWLFIKSKLPPEFDKTKVWLEVMNEVDKNKSEWLAEFCLEINQLALDYKLVFFNWSTGEPETSHWQGIKMSQLFRLCESNKQRLAIGLHEYSLNIHNIKQDWPYLVGRVSFLRNYYSGTVFITEFGWTHNDLKPELVVDHIAQVYQFYIDNKVDGIALWCLNKGWQGIDEKLSLSLPDVSNWLKTNYKAIIIPPVSKIKHTIHLLPQDTTLIELEAVSRYLHPNRTAFTYSADVCKDLMYQGTDDSKVVIWDASRWNGNIKQWFNDRGIVNLEFRSFNEIINTPPLPPPNSYQYRGRQVTFTPAIHAPGSDWMFGQPELRTYLHTINLPIKFMTNGVSSDYYDEFKDNRLDLVRVYYQFGNTYKTPQVLFDELKGDIEKFYLKGARQFELFNEPNLTQEGLGVFWNNGAEFGNYIKTFGELCKQKFPLIKLYYPGLSPGVPYTNQLVFTNQAWPIFKPIADGFCIHAYTGITNDKYAAMNDICNQITSLQSYLNLQVPLIISECSVNRGQDYDYKANVYRLVEFKLRDKPGIEGLVYFISLWNPPPEQASHGESWYGTDIWEHYK